MEAKLASQLPSDDKKLLAINKAAWWALNQRREAAEAILRPILEASKKEEYAQAIFDAMKPSRGLERLFGK